MEARLSQRWRLENSGSVARDSEPPPLEPLRVSKWQAPPAPLTAAVVTAASPTALIPPQPLRLRDSLQRDRIRGRPECHALLLRQVAHGGVGLRDRRLELTIHLVVRPAVLLEVLGPLVVTDRHAAGIREEIG